MSANNSWIKLQPFGGANTVTGSSYLFTVTLGKREKNYLVDCGLFTENEASNLNTNIADIVKKIDAILVTHAHVDHIGRLPYVYKLGYRGPIYSTEPVRALSNILLRDSANIQEQEYMETLRKARLKKKLIDFVDLEPLYTISDAEEVMNQFVTINKGKTIKIDENLEVRFYNAGHNLGSASIMLIFNNGYETFKVYCSGDIGQNNPILKQRRDSFKENVDFVIMESTYAGRLHPRRQDCWTELRELVAKTISKGGNVVIPAFAVGRTQELLYLYYKDMAENDDWVARLLRRTPIFVDSNMAVLATKEFERYNEELNESVRRLITDSENGPFNFPQLTFIPDAEASKNLTMHCNNYVVISAAGMCNAGRVRFHLAKDLGNPKSAVILTGYQAEGTLGRQLLDGISQVKMNGVPIEVKAKITSIPAVSGHVDQNGLIKWLKNISPGYKLFIGHGNPEMQYPFKEELANLGVVSQEDIEVMSVGRCYHLYKGGYTTEKLQPVHIEKPTEVHDKEMMKAKQIERIRKFLMVTPTTCLDAETLKLLSALDNRLAREQKKQRKAEKSQSKPNRRYMKKRRDVV